MAEEQAAEWGVLLERAQRAEAGERHWRGIAAAASRGASALYERLVAERALFNAHFENRIAWFKGEADRFEASMLEWAQRAREAMEERDQLRVEVQEWANRARTAEADVEHWRQHGRPRGM